MDRGYRLGGDHEPAGRPDRADAYRDRFEDAAAQNLPGAAGEIHKRRGREPVADRPPPLLGDHRAGEPRPLKGGVELLGDRVQQRAVGGLVEHDLAQAAELGREYLRQLGLERDVGLRQVPEPVEQVQWLPV